MTEANGNTTRGGSEQVIIEVMKTAIRNALSAKNTNEAINRVNEIKDESNQVKKELDNQVEQDPNSVPKDIPGKVGDEDSLKHKATKTKITVQEVMKTYREEKLIPPSVGRIGTEMIKNLANKIDQSFITEQTSPYLYQIINKALNGQIKNVDDLSQIFRQMDYLIAYNPTLYQKIHESLVETALSEGSSQSEIDQKFNMKENSLVQKIQRNASGNRMAPSAEDWDKYEQIHKQINKALSKAFENEKVGGDDRYKVLRFLFGDNSLNEGEMLAIFNKLGLPNSREMITNYNSLRKQLFENGLNLEFIKQYMPQFSRYIDQAQSEFKLDSLLKNGFVTKNEKDGSLEFKRKDRLRFQDLIQEYYYYALEKVHDDKSKLFQESSGQSMEYQYYFGAIRQIISNACDQLKKYHFQDNNEIQEFLTDKSSRYQASIMTFARTFHDLPLYARNVESFEKWPEFLGYLFPSELAEVFDENDRFMQTARETITQYTRMKIVQNGNKVPADLISGEYKTQGVRWSLKFEEDIKNMLKSRAGKLGIDLSGRNEWKLRRALTYAPGIGIANLVDYETMSTADPNTPANFKGVPPLLSAISAKFNWGLGRGDPVAGVFSKYLLGMPVTMFPEDRGFIPRLFHKRKWVPKAFANMIDSQVKEYTDLILTDLFDRGSTYQELLSMVNIATSLISRHGWRMNPIRDELKGTFKEEKPGMDFEHAWDQWTAKDWKEIFDLSLRDYGNASLWWFVNSNLERLDTEMKRLLVDQEKTGRDKAFEEWNEFSSGKRALEKIMFDGDKKHSFLEVRQLRLYQLRGESFYRYMRRNPGDFLLLLSQTVPELANANINIEDLARRGITLNENEIRILNSDIFVDDSEIKSYETALKKIGKTDLEIRQIISRRERVKNSWQEEFATLRNVRRWLIENSKTQKSVKDFITFFTEGASVAFARMMSENDKYKQRIENAETEDEKKTLKAEYAKKFRLYLKKEDFFSRETGEEKEKQLARMVFDEGGLFNLLTGQNYDNLGDEKDFGYLENFGDYNKLGKKTAFFYMAQGWTLKEGDINPFSSDFNHFAVYKHLGEVGEDVVKRYLGDANAVKKMVEGVSKLDVMLAEIATGQIKLDELYKLHMTMYSTLKGIISDEYAIRANYILAQIVTQFFWEHSLTRNASLKYLGAGLLTRLFVGTKISLSKILTGNRHAYSMDENAARDYFRHLAYDLHVLPHEGAWSNEQLELAFDSKQDTFIFGDVLPSVMWLLLLYLIWTYAKKALEESQGKKK